MGKEGGREQERVRGDGKQTDRQGERMTKWQRRARAALWRGFRVIKTDRETDEQTKGELWEQKDGEGRKDGGRDQ